MGNKTYLDVGVMHGKAGEKVLLDGLGHDLEGRRYHRLPHSPYTSASRRNQDTSLGLIVLLSATQNKAVLAILL